MGKRVNWTPENDRTLLLQLIPPTSSIPIAALTQLFPGSTPKAIEERLAKLRREAKLALTTLQISLPTPLSTIATVNTPASASSSFLQTPTTNNAVVTPLTPAIFVSPPGPPPSPITPAVEGVGVLMAGSSLDEDEEEGEEEEKEEIKEDEEEVDVEEVKGALVGVEGKVEAKDKAKGRKMCAATSNTTGGLFSIGDAPTLGDRKRRREMDERVSRLGVDGDEEGDNEEEERGRKRTRAGEEWIV